MSYNGSGTFVINTAGQPVLTGTTISSTTFNALTSDLATGLTTALTIDGQSTPTADITMGAFKIVSLAAGTVASDAARLDQVQGGTSTYITVTGTDTITGTVLPALAAYAAGNQFSFVVANTNTAAVTINIDGMGAKAITRTGSTALVAGDMIAGQAVEIIYDGTRFQLINGNSFTNVKVSGTLAVTGVATFTAQPIASSLTALLPIFTDASKGLVSNAMTGTGSVVMSTSPILVTPDLGTPTALVGTNITGTATNFTVGTSQKTDALNSATTIVNVSSSPAPTNGQILTATSGTAAVWSTPSAAATATNLAGGSNGTIPYQSAAGTTQMLAVGTSGQVLQTNGVGAPTWVTASSGLAAATQAQMETATSNTVAATPLSTNWHPGVAKCFVNADVAGNIGVSHNVTSITDVAVGVLTVTWNVDFSSATYVTQVTLQSGSTPPQNGGVRNSVPPTVGDVTCWAGTEGFFPQDPVRWDVVAFGDQ